MVTNCSRHSKRLKFYRSVIQMLMIFLQYLLNHLYLLIAIRGFPTNTVLPTTRAVMSHTPYYELQQYLQFGAALSIT